MPPHHPIFGHLLITNKTLSKLPRDAHAHYLPSQLGLAYSKLGPVYYLDMWPFAPPFLVAISPTVISQFTQAESHLDNHPGIRKYLLPITGGGDLASLKGDEWKRWRKIYNPGFGAAHIQTLIPTIVEEIGVFVEILKEHALRKDVFAFDEAAINVTMDVIGRVALNHEFHTQQHPNPMTTALRSQLRWCSFGAEPNPFDYMNPLKPLVHWYNARIMNNYMTTVLEERYSSSSSSPSPSKPSTTATSIEASNNNNRSKKWKSKAVVDLAYAEFQSSSPQAPNESFAKAALPQMKLFILGGHDTTATTITYLFHLLSNPSHSHHLRKLRKEHDSVFGSNPADAAEKLKENPALLNQLPFTLAVIKETLRLFPVVTAPRAGEKGHYITTDEGVRMPTEGCLVWSCHHGLHRNPNYWPRATEFVPERWMVEEGDELKPMKDAWRPFEFGPRACIGRELAVTELKVVLVLSVRCVMVRGAYGEWDELHGRKGRKEVEGERAYQIQLGSARASDGFPARAELVDWGGNEEG
ncbi:MAG: hypothetical protein Q9213_002912 [Squamulea squamosa]